MAGTYVAESWPEDRRKMGAGYLQTGYYRGFFVAAAFNFTIGASYGWRAMFLCGLAPVIVSVATVLGGSALPAFPAVLFFLGMFGGNFAIVSLWLPELFGTDVRAIAFAFGTSVSRFIGAGVSLALAAAVGAMGTLGIPIAITAVAFVIGLLVIPFARETRGQTLPES